MSPVADKVWPVPLRLTPKVPPLAGVPGAGETMPFAKVEPCKVMLPFVAVIEPFTRMPA